MEKLTNLIIHSIIILTIQNNVIIKYNVSEGMISKKKKLYSLEIEIEFYDIR